MKKESPRKNPNKWLVFATMPFQMAIIIYIFYWVGQLLDTKYMVEEGWWSKGMTITGVLVSLYHFIKQVNYINRSE